jgi:hypothetical protein
VRVQEYSREFLDVSIRDSLVETPNIANDMFVSIILTSSSQWRALFHHLRYFMWWNINNSAKEVRAIQLVELVRINPITMH